MNYVSDAAQIHHINLRFVALVILFTVLEFTPNKYIIRIYYLPKIFSISLDLTNT